MTAICRLRCHRVILLWRPWPHFACVTPHEEPTS